MTKLEAWLEEVKRINSSDCYDSPLTALSYLEAAAAVIEKLKEALEEINTIDDTGTGDFIEDLVKTALVIDPEKL